MCAADCQTRWTWVFLLGVFGTAIGLLFFGSAPAALVDNLAYVTWLHGDPSAALTLFRQVPVAREPGIRGLFRVLVSEHEFAQASALAAQHDIVGDKTMTYWLLRTAEGLLGANDSDNARCTLDLLLDYGHLDAKLWYRMGFLYRDAGALAKARQSYRAGIEHDPAGKFAYGWHYLASLEAQAGNWQTVMDILDPILNDAPDARLDGYPWRDALDLQGASLRVLGLTDESEQVYRRLIGLDPTRRDGTSHFAYIALGDAALRRGDWSSAAEHYALAYDCALTIGDHARRAYEERAWQRLPALVDWMASHQLMAEATERTQQSAGMTPDSPGWRLLLGLLSERADRTAEAIQAYTLAQNLAPQALVISEQLERLRSDRDRQ